MFKQKNSPGPKKATSWFQHQISVCWMLQVWSWSIIWTRYIALSSRGLYPGPTHQIATTGSEPSEPRIRDPSLHLGTVEMEPPKNLAICIELGLCHGCTVFSGPRNWLLAQNQESIEVGSKISYSYMLNPTKNLFSLISSAIAANNYMCSGLTTYVTRMISKLSFSNWWTGPPRRHTTCTILNALQQCNIPYNMWHSWSIIIVVPSLGTIRHHKLHFPMKTKQYSFQ